MLDRRRLEFAEASAREGLRERCLMMAVQSFGSPPDTGTALSRADAFLKFVKGG
jgi:hypothetical protein